MQIKPLVFVVIKNYPRQSVGIKEILLKIRPKELGKLNTPTHLSCFHPKFLSLDETLPMHCDVVMLKVYPAWLHLQVKEPRGVFSHTASKGQL